MKYYSEKLNKVFDTEAELVAEEERVETARVTKEKELAKYKEDRAAKAKEVEEAYAAANEARKKYEKILREFNSKYGAFHMSISIDDIWNNFLFRSI